MQTGLYLPCTASGSAKRKKIRAQTSHLSTQNSTNITQTPKAGCACRLRLQLLLQIISLSLFPGLCLALLCRPVPAEICPLSLQSLSCGFCDGQRYISRENEGKSTSKSTGKSSLPPPAFCCRFYQSCFQGYLDKKYFSFQKVRNCT